MKKILLTLLATVLFYTASFAETRIKPTSWPITIYAPMGHITINGETGIVEVSGGWNVVWY